MPSEAEREADARCIRWQHHKRPVGYCANPHCPGKGGKDWQPFERMAELNDDLEDEDEDDIPTET